MKTRAKRSPFLKAPAGYAWAQETLNAFGQDHPEPDRNVFVAMRFRREKIFLQLYAAIKDALLSVGLKGLRADDKIYPADGDLWSNVCVYMLGCKFGICVFDELEEREFNPNIALEYGFMRALNKPVLLLKERRMPRMPTDLVGKIYRDFDAYNIEDSVRARIIEWVGDLSLSPSTSIGFGNCRPGQVFANNIQFSPCLMNLITSSRRADALLVSVGDGDATHVLLRRLYDPMKFNNIARPGISCVVLRHWSDEMIADLCAQGKLEPTFARRLEYNLSELGRYLTAMGVSFLFRPWPAAPPFHGYLYGDHLFRGQWASSELGIMHVRTPVTYYTRQSHPDVWQESLSALSNKGSLI